MIEPDYDKYVRERASESPRDSRRRYTLWLVFIVAVFSATLGFLLGSSAVI